jgi:hypothetical protein
MAAMAPGEYPKERSVADKIICLASRPTCTLIVGGISQKHFTMIAFQIIRPKSKTYYIGEIL